MSTAPAGGSSAEDPDRWDGERRARGQAQPEAVIRLGQGIVREQDRLSALVAEAAARCADLQRLAGVLGSVRDDRDGTAPEVLAGVGAVRARLAELSRVARREALTFAPGGAQSQPARASSAPLDEAALRRGVGLRTIYLNSAAHDPGTRRHVAQLALRGAEYRTTTTLPLRMVIVDREVALLPTRVDCTAAGALVVRTPGIITALVALFERYWERALPFGCRDTTGFGRLTHQQRQVALMLADGTRDEDVALAMGISVRTVRRLVAGLSQQLGAVSRFQAAARLERQGWLREKAHPLGRDESHSNPWV